MKKLIGTLLPTVGDFNPRAAISTIVVLGMLVFAWYAGGITLILESDKTFLSVLIGATALYGLWLACWNRWRTVEWLEPTLIMMGLIGTIIGFIIAFSGVDPDQVSNLSYVKEIIGTLLSGMGTALYTTLVGSLGAVTLSFFRHRYERT